MALTDDQWVRLFNVSDPRRAYAGHTLYKVTSKVFQKEFPEGATEIAVWRRFSDFKKLHHELLNIYSHKHFKEEEFPPFPKAKFFGRFEEGVIEERRKAGLELLNFAGNIPDLFTSQPFVKFFEGGFPDSPILSDSVVSREGSSSDAESESPRTTPTTQEDTNPDNAVQTGQQSLSPPCASSKENGDNLDDVSFGGVWLCKQPSLTEGLDNLDNLTSDEEGDEHQEPSETTLAALAEPRIKPAGLTRQSNEETNVDISEDHDDVFVDDDEDDECSEKETEITERKEMGSDSEPPNWLVRAISICSEGEDLEALASEADTSELSFPEAFSDYAYCSDEQRTSEESKLVKEHEGDYLHYKYTDVNSQIKESPSSHVLRNNLDTQEVKEEVDKTHHPESSESISCTSFDSENSLKDSSFVSTTEDKQSFTSSSDSAKGISRQRTISDLGNIYIDPKESDYLYAAGHTIHKALDCEVNGRYEEAFSLYKSCVSLLLSGVQGEKDIKRREAVRRKTAQYLLKAEALYNTYLAGKDSPEKSEQDSVPPHSGSRICESDDLQKFKDLTLADLKVMGIVGKVMLVENIHNGETYVVKALCKSGATRAHGHSHGNERRRRSVRRLYGKYPNIVRLYRYFETATTIYLLLEYAQGGRLWDHIAGYQSHKESLEYVKGKNNQRNAGDFNKFAYDQTEVKTVVNNYTNNPERLSSENGSKALEIEDSCVNNRTGIKSSSNSMQASAQVGQDSISHASVAQSKLDSNIDGINVSRNGHNNKLVSDGKEACESKKEAANKPSLFVKLDEYFASSAQRVPSEHIQIWAAELVLAVAYLHTAGIICRDLNPKNVLLDEEGHVLLTYFGSWEETEHIPDEEAMNYFYCAPETWQVDEVTAVADWWSVGALLYEMITGKALSAAHPWGIKTHTELQLSMKISSEARSLLRELLRVMPSERLGSGVNGVEEIKSHPFFSGINWGWLCSRIN